MPVKLTLAGIDIVLIHKPSYVRNRLDGTSSDGKVSHKILSEQDIASQSGYEFAGKTRSSTVTGHRVKYRVNLNTEPFFLVIEKMSLRETVDSRTVRENECFDGFVSTRLQPFSQNHWSDIVMDIR